MSDDTKMVNIAGLDKAEVFAALFNNARTQGLGILHYVPREMSVDEARDVLRNHAPYFDYFEGRVMKVDLSEDELFAGAYDRDNGQGSVARIIAELRAKQHKS